MNQSAGNSSQESRPVTKLESALSALNTYAKSLNYDTADGERRSIQATNQFASEVQKLRLNENEHKVFWELFNSLSSFQINVHEQLKAETKKELKELREEAKEKRRDLVRNWGGIVILTVALLMIVGFFIFGLLNSSSGLVALCYFGGSVLSLGIVTLFFYGEYEKAYKLLQSIVDKIDLIQKADAKSEKSDETLD